MRAHSNRPRLRGDGRVFRRGRVYWIAYCCRLDGKVREVRETAKTDDENEAWAVLARRIGKARDPKTDFDPRADKITFDELAALKRMFSIAVQTRKGFRYRPYLPLLAEDNARDGFLEPADFEVVRTYLPPDVADAATFAYLTGWRKGEVKTLEWRDVDLRAGMIRLRAENSKNKRPRLIALRGELLDVIQQRASLRRLDCLRVFHRNGKPVGNFRKAWLAACRKAGQAGRLFHDMRRSAIRNMVRAGVPERVAMAISGHRTRSVFDRYNITSEADVAAAVERTSAYVVEQRRAEPGVSPLSDNSRTTAATERAVGRAGD